MKTKLLLILASIIMFGCGMEQQEIPAGYELGRSLGRTDVTSYQKVLSHNGLYFILADSSAYSAFVYGDSINFVGKEIRFIGGVNLTIYDREVEKLVSQGKLYYKGYPVQGFDGHRRSFHLLTPKSEYSFSRDDVFIMVKQDGYMEIKDCGAVNILIKKTVLN